MKMGGKKTKQNKTNFIHIVYSTTHITCYYTFSPSLLLSLVFFFEQRADLYATIHTY